MSHDLVRGWMMSKITLTLGALMVGLVLGSLFSTGRAATQSQAPSSGVPQIFGGATIDCAGIPGCTPLGLPNRQPQVPVLGPPLAHMTFARGTQPLDGLDCDDCIFADTTLIYGGGAFNLKNAQFSGTTHLELNGAAANTLAMLNLVEAIMKGTVKPKVSPPNKAISKTAKAPAPLKGMNISSPFVGR